MHQWGDKHTEDDGHDDDGQAPVLAEAKEELDDVEYPVLEYFPHTMVFLPLTDKKPPAEAPPLRNGIVAVRPSRSTP